jgi:hypothetical protein
MTSLKALYSSPAMTHTDATLVAMLVKEYGLNAGEGAANFLNHHRRRRLSIAQRIRLYRDHAQRDFEAVIENIFEKVDVQEQRKKLIGVATERNVTARVVNEVASLYDQPALRTFEDDATTERFRKRAVDVSLDEVMQEAQRLTFLCNETLIWSVAADVQSEGTPELQIITPDAFDAIPHPSNKLWAVGFIIDTAPGICPDGVDRTKLKHYEIWDDTFTYHVALDGTLLATIEHKQGRIPGVLFHRRMPVDCLLDSHSGGDITAAHLGVGLLAILAMRLAKSQGERQPVLSGNLANIASGQSADGEKPLYLPPGVTASMLDSMTSPEHYIMLLENKVDGIEETYGIPPKDTSGESGASFEARRRKLTELRNEQRRRARIHEKAIVVLLGFNADTLEVDHQEQAVPVDAAQELALLDSKVRMGLDSPVAYLMRKDPDLTYEDAVDKITANLADWAMLITMLRRLNMPSNANAANPGNDPNNPAAQNLVNKQIGAPLGAEQAAPSNGANDGSATPKSTYTAT